MEWENIRSNFDCLLLFGRIEFDIRADGNCALYDTFFYTSCSASVHPGASVGLIWCEMTSIVLSLRIRLRSDFPFQPIASSFVWLTTRV